MIVLRLGVKQAELVRRALTSLDLKGPEAKSRDMLLAKLDPKPVLSTRPDIPTPADIEGALVASSMGKVVPIVGATAAFWIKQRRLIESKGVTVDGAKRVGTWLRSQTWMTGTATIENALHKWESWYANAANAAGDAGTGTGGGRRSAAW